LVLVAALAMGCTFQFVEEGPYTETFDRAGCTAVELEGIDGDVLVQGSDSANAITIRGERRALGSTRERARGNLERVFLEPHVDGADLVLAFDPPLEMIGLLDLELLGPSTIPVDLGLKVEVVEGDMTVEDVAGAIDLESEDGDVSVTGAGPGRVHVVTGDGEAAVEALGPVVIDSARRASLAVPDVEPSPVEIECGGGAILLEIAPQAMEITVHTEGGELTVDPVLGLELTSSGNAGEYLATDSDEFDGPRKSIKLSSHGGDIQVVSLPSE